MLREATAMFMVTIVGIGLVFLALERLFPDQELNPVPGWWARVIAANVVQVAIIIVAGMSWDLWLQRASLLDLGTRFSPFTGGLIGYLAATLVYYLWHRARHESDLLWRLCHQLHHSPSLIETITSFYKHPVELIFNSLISSATSYTLLGLSIEGAAWVTLWSGIAEFFYHMNIRTPHWVGYFVQRPEMHRIHHERGRHHSNFGDLPIWDMLFGTYRNPETYKGPCGFKPEREMRVKDILLFKNVNGTRT